MAMSDEIERFFSVSEAGRILGCERSTIYDRIKTGRLKAVRLDGTKRIPRSELVRLIATAVPLTVAS
jgi:excisionase family DNA binding protein